MTSGDKSEKNRLHKLVDIDHANVNELSPPSVTTESETGPLALQTHARPPISSHRAPGPVVPQGPPAAVRTAAGGPDPAGVSSGKPAGCR